MKKISDSFRPGYFSKTKVEGAATPPQTLSKSFMGLLPDVKQNLGLLLTVWLVTSIYIEVNYWDAAVSIRTDVALNINYGRLIMALCHMAFQ